MPADPQSPKVVEREVAVCAICELPFTGRACEGSIRRPHPPNDVVVKHVERTEPASLVASLQEENERVRSDLVGHAMLLNQTEAEVARLQARIEDLEAHDAESYVPLSVRYGPRRARLRWWLQGRCEALALRLAPWLAGPSAPEPDPLDLTTRITAALQRAGVEPLVANASRPLDELVAELTDKQRAEGARQEREKLQEAFREQIIEGCEFFLSSAEKYGDPEPYGMRTMLNRANHLAALLASEEGR